MIFILAGNLHQAREYADAHRLATSDGKFIVGAHTLRGMRDMRYVRVGTWRHRYDIAEVEQALRIYELIEQENVL